MSPNRNVLLRKIMSGSAAASTRSIAQKKTLPALTWIGLPFFVAIATAPDSRTVPPNRPCGQIRKGRSVS